MGLGIFPFSAHTPLEVDRKSVEPLNCLVVLSTYRNLIPICWGGGGVGAIGKSWNTCSSPCTFLGRLLAMVNPSHVFSFSFLLVFQELWNKRPVFKKKLPQSLKDFQRTLEHSTYYPCPAPTTRSPQPLLLCATDTPTQSMLCLSAHVMRSVHLVKPCCATQCSQAPCS